jgi:hypothetical protein
MGIPITKGRRGRRLWIGVLCGLIVLAIAPFVWSRVSARQREAQAFKEDYVLACNLIASRYVYLEQKLGVPRKQFVTEHMRHAEEVHWLGGERVFRREMMALRALFPDGHFDISWRQPGTSATGARFLGFVLTAGKSGTLRVARVYPDLKDKLHVGDEILTWNGRPVEEALLEIERELPCSTPAATREIAARMLTLDLPWQPLREAYPPVRITFRSCQGGETRALEVPWEQKRFVIDVLKQDEHDAVTCTPNAVPSTECIPPDATFLTKGLLYYQRVIQGKRFFIIHPRAFHAWGAGQIDDLLHLLAQEHPEALVIDLHDSAGGDSQNCALLLKAVNALDGDFLKGEIKPTDTLVSRPWSGKVLLRTNSMTGSCGDLFARQMRLTGRGLLFGTPTAGRGGGYDTFPLPRTGTALSFPIGDCHLGKRQESVEGHSVMPEFLCDMFDGSIEEQIAALQSKGMFNKNLQHP